MAAGLAFTAARPAAAADPLADDQSAPAAPIAGALTALVPMAVGGVLWSQDDRPARQRIGAELILSGLAAAPWIAHVGGGRPRRSLVFGLTALTTSAAALVAMDVTDPFNPAVANHQRVAFGALLSASLLTSAIGILGGFWVASQRGVGR